MALLVTCKTIMHATGKNSLIECGIFQIIICCVDWQLHLHSNLNTNFFKRYNTTTRRRDEETIQCYHYFQCSTCKSAKISLNIMQPTFSTPTCQVKRSGIHSPSCYNSLPILPMLQPPHANHRHPMNNYLYTLHNPSSDENISHVSFMYESHPVIIRFIDSNPKAQSQVLKDYIKALLNITTSLSTTSLNRILRNVIFNVENKSLSAQFNLLPSFLMKLKEMNPKMTLILETSDEGNNSFYRMFIALPNLTSFVGVATLKIISADAAASRSNYYDGITVIFVTKSGMSI